MPDEAIDSVRIQKPLDRKLKYKNDRGENGKSPKIHAIDIELANHGMLLHVTRAAALGPDCAPAGPLLFASADVAAHPGRASAASRQPQPHKRGSLRRRLLFRRAQYRSFVINRREAAAAGRAPRSGRAKRPRQTAGPRACCARSDMPDAMDCVSMMLTPSRRSSSPPTNRFWLCAFRSQQSATGSSNKDRKICA
jgi:hypothetical protein